MKVTAVIVSLICASLVIYSLKSRRNIKRDHEIERELTLWIMDLKDTAFQEDSPVKSAQTLALTSRILDACRERSDLNEKFADHFHYLFEMAVILKVAGILLAIAVWFC